MTPSEVADYLVVKRGLYYCPNAMGYTGIKECAGRYTKSEAEDHADPRSGVTIIHESEAPEYSEKCFDDVARDHMAGRIRALITENEAKDAEIERLREVLERSKEFAVTAESRRLYAIKDKSAEIRDEHEPCPWPKVARRVREKALRSYRQAITGKEEK